MTDRTGADLETIIMSMSDTRDARKRAAPSDSISQSRSQRQ
jgi:hypothetical protein